MGSLLEAAMRGDERRGLYDVLHSGHLHFHHHRRAVHSTTNCMELYGVAGLQVYRHEYPDPGTRILHSGREANRSEGAHFGCHM